MNKTVGNIVAKQSLQRIMDSVMPGGPNWQTFVEKDGNCLKSCPHFKADTCSGPDGRICSSDWSKSEPTPEVVDVLFHVFNNFDHYNQQDLSSLDQHSKPVTELRQVFFRLAKDIGIEEGSRKLRTHFYRERNSAAARKRKEATLASKSVVCAACETDFFKIYGPLSISVIECHHNVPISSPKYHGVTKMKDLVLLCANCHRLVHSKKVGLSMKKLRALVRR